MKYVSITFIFGSSTFDCEEVYDRYILVVINKRAITESCNNHLASTFMRHWILQSNHLKHHGFHFFMILYCTLIMLFYYIIISYKRRDDLFTGKLCNEQLSYINHERLDLLFESSWFIDGNTVMEILNSREFSCEK